MYVLERNINQTLWYAIMDHRYQGGEFFENDTFIVKPYNWVHEDANDWHFWHKPSGLKLYWYKYPLRSVESNIDITHEQFYAVLHDCMNSVYPKRQDCTFEKWW